MPTRPCLPEALPGPCLPTRCHLLACCHCCPFPQAEKDCDALRAEINRITAQAHEQEAALAEHSATISQLQGAVAEADQVGWLPVGGVVLVGASRAACDKVVWSRQASASLRAVRPLTARPAVQKLCNNPLLTTALRCMFDCLQARLKLRKELDVALGERDVLGTQLVRSSQSTLLYLPVHGQPQFQPCSQGRTGGPPCAGLAHIS